MIQRDSLARHTLDTLPFNIAVLDEDGTILFTNRSWQEFGDGDSTEGDMVGIDYFSGMDEEDTDEYARKALTGIEAVLADKQDLFTLEYPCHGPDTKQWFLMRATRLPDHDIGHVVIAHIDITQRKLAEIEAREQREDLEHLMDRIDGLIRNVMVSVLQASSRDELEEVVCHELVDVDPYISAWVGRVNLRTESIEPTASAGEHVPPEAATLPLSADDPTAIAAREGKNGIVQDTSEHELGEVHWTILQDRSGSNSASTRAKQPIGGSLAAFPLVYGETSYGVLTIYAQETNAFNARELAVIEVLAGVCSTAINAIEGRRILTADQIIELEIGLSNEGPFFSDLASNLGCSLEYEGSVYEDETDLAMLFVVDGATPEAVMAEANSHPDILDAIHIYSDGEKGVYEFHVSEPPILTELAERGIETTAITADGPETRLTLELHASVDPRSVVEQFSTEYRSTELLARKERERPGKTKQEFVAEIESALTDRQRLALHRAFFGGFFDWPRDITGKELADSMEITPSTYHQHLRGAQKKIISALFEE